MVKRYYKDLIVWQKALELVTEVYRATKNFPREEIYGLTNQLRRAAVSIPSNIAAKATSQTENFDIFSRMPEVR